MKEVNSENVYTEDEVSKKEGQAGGKSLDGTSISPESALEIKILLSKDDAAKGNVIDFFKQVIPDLTEVEEERLCASDGFDGAELMGFKRHHQVSEESYQLWKVEDQSNNATQTEMQPLNKHQGAKISVAAILTGTGVPVSNGDTHQMTVRARPKTGKGKRYHVQTPMKKKQVNGVVVNARNASVPLKKTRSEATEENEIPRRLLHEFAEEALSSESDSGEHADATTSQDNWQVLWDKKATEWTRRTKVRFPRTTDTERQWTAASIKEPLLLIQMMREFAFPARVLERSSAQQLAQWTSGWRVECLQEELHSLRNRLEQGPAKQWASKWLSRLHNSATNQQRQLVADSSDDWNHATALGKRYSRDLELCSPKHKSKLGRHLLSTLCYAIELKARSQLPVQKSQTVHQMLQLHLQHVDHDENLKAAFENADDYVDWDSVHTFFTAKALEIVHQTQLHN
ncbi:hypothetical protein PF002_g16260 [Phytophthora fragariae]|nr:hypothetical protein PF009_g16061 [Phytophthora fragariae]KAE9101586.1 hypothetical protein PF007_g15086 [Phytophthora fragariae]KAE9138544.1 hypothetical protein PF006_g13927 [Phytophthora fragariae]KAE9218144.1 hypothetical protein PF004_g13949 [Phytophthora fragariae]KAE9219168.1 hypothetical protein PF002_g16260 [Phytophthora fragariae]